MRTSGEIVMAKQLLFYATAVPVSARRHGRLSVRTGDSYGFARGVNSVPLTAAEFVMAAGEFPIVFAGEGDATVPTAILGVEGATNAFVDAEGRWTARYIPTFVRRYPFVFSHETEDKRLLLHIDETFEGCNTEGRGERLFDSEGQQTQYLKGVLALLQDYQAQFNRTRAFCNRLVEHDLLRPMQATFTLPSGERRQLTGFKAIDRDRLKTLDEATVMGMLRTDEMECVFLHLSSLRHFGAVAQKSDGAMATEATAPA
jgi:hypothetical protein